MSETQKDWLAVLIYFVSVAIMSAIAILTN